MLLIFVIFFVAETNCTHWFLQRSEGHSACGDVWIFKRGDTLSLHISYRWLALSRSGYATFGVVHLCLANIILLCGFYFVLICAGSSRHCCWSRAQHIWQSIGKGHILDVLAPLTCQFSCSNILFFAICLLQMALNCTDILLSSIVDSLLYSITYPDERIPWPHNIGMSLCCFIQDGDKYDKNSLQCWLTDVHVTAFCIKEIWEVYWDLY